MPYPLVQFPTFQEFITRLCNDFGCQLKTMDGELIDPEGEKHPVHYLERTVDGKTVRCAFTMDDPETRVMQSVLRYICGRLGVPVESFGLILG